MRLGKHQIIAFVFVVLALNSQKAFAQYLEKQIALPHVEGRIDHFAIDLSGQRLFVSALGNHTLEIVDLKRSERVGSIPNLKEPQGAFYDSDTNRLFVASDADGTVRSYDGKSFTPLKTASLGDDADNVRYDPQTKYVIVGYGDGGLATFDAGLHKISDVKLPAHPESFQLEQKGSRTFVNLPNNSSIGVIDRKTNKLVAKWHVPRTAANFPMALDEKNKRLFIGCRNPARLLVFDTDNGKPIAELFTVGDTDDLFYDAKRKQIYVIGGEGFLDVFEQQDADRYRFVSRTKTSAGARTGFFAPALNLIFIAAPKRGSSAARILVYQVD